MRRHTHTRVQPCPAVPHACPVTGASSGQNIASPRENKENRTTALVSNAMNPPRVNRAVPLALCLYRRAALRARRALDREFNRFLSIASRCSRDSTRMVEWYDLTLPHVPRRVSFRKLRDFLSRDSFFPVTSLFYARLDKTSSRSRWKRKDLCVTCVWNPIDLEV